MSFVVVVVLSVLWLGFFLPGLLRSRRSSPYISAATFQECLTRISTGSAVDAAELSRRPRRRLSRRQVARRRDTLAGLGGTAVAAAALAMSFGGAAWWLLVPPLVALGGYLVVLRMDVVRLQDVPVPVVPQPPVRVVAPPEAGGEIVASVGRRDGRRGADPALERIAG